MKKFFSIFVAVLISVAMWGTTYTVAGNNTDILGASWTPSATANDMINTGGNTYKLVKSGLNITSATTLEYKVCADHAWTTSYGDGGNNASLSVPVGTKAIIFSFDAGDSKTVGATCTSGNIAIVGDAAIANGENWNNNVAANVMTTSNNTTYTLTLTGVELTKDVNYSYKIIEKGSWTEYYPNTGDNASFSVNQSAIYTVTYTFNVSTLTCVVTKTKTGEIENPAKFYVSGDSALVVDAGKDKSKAWTANAIKSEKDTLTLNLKGGTDYLLKVVDGTSWKGYNDLTEKAEGLQNVSDDHNIGFRLNAAGEVKVIYTSTIFKLIGDFEMPATFYVTGDSALVVDAGLAASKAWNTTAIKSEKDTLVLNLKAGQDYQLKVSVDGTWDTQKTFANLSEVADGLQDLDGDNHNIGFKLSKAGSVKVIYKAGETELFKLIGDFCVDSTTLYFVNVPDWATVKAHAFVGETPYKAWPGADMKPTGEQVNGYDIYSFTFPSSYNKIIFNKGEGGADNQTADLTWNAATPYFYPTTKDDESQYNAQWYANTAAMPGKYYVTGDSALVVDAGLTADKKWNAAAFKATTDTVVLKNLKANQEYNLKVTLKGAWEPASDVKGYTDLTILDDGLSTKGDNNIKFTLNSAGDVKVIYTGEVFKLLGDFKEPEFDPAIQQRLKLVPHCWSEANAKIAAYTWGKKIEGKWTGFFAGYNESDTLRATIRTAADSMVLVRFATEVEAPDWKLEEEEGKVWNKIDKILIDHTGLVYTIVDWSTGTWDSFIPATFYATGDSALVVDAGLDKAKAWNADAIKAIADTLVLKNLKAGQDYMLKVTLDGTWEGENNVKGYDELTEKADGLLRGTGEQNNNNICFKLNTAGDVKIVYTSSLFKLIGDFYVKTYETKTVKFVPSEEWLDANAKFAAWTWGAEQDGKWSAFFTPVSEDNDTLQATIKTSADSIDFVRFSPKAAEPSWASKDSSYVLVWNELKDTIDWKGLTASIEGWNTLTWEPVAKPCESFGLLINGVYHAGKKNVMQSSWLEYKLLSVELKKDDVLKVRNDCEDANWVITSYMDNSFIIPNDGSKYTVESDGTYDFYIKLGGGDAIYISKAGFSTQAVPNQCEDVLMQAFYNESYNDYAAGVSTLGDTRWNTLAAQAEDIRSYFDLVWLPPSAAGDGMGYHPKDYGNQSSNWGTAAELDNLIKTLHGPDPNKIQARVVADIVINHCQSSSGWMGFPEFDFGTYGQFQPVGEWICANDEVNWADGSDAKGQAKGPDDDGENWSGARDWSHSNVDVQNMFKAYLKWMRDVVGYDGFRYDKGDGFDNWHHDNYNKNAGPYIAFMECYSNTDNIWWRIEKANHNLMALDFDTKWHMFDAIAGWDYNGKYDKWRGDGLLGRGLGHYAIEFIDSHDWFLRDDNSNEFGGHGNSLTPALKARLLQANAFLLSMPGVPCVFYPHWKTYPTEIKEMIDARKWAGVHSDSEIRDEYASSSGYQATMVGKYGYLILCLGDQAHKSVYDFPGYSLMSSYYETNDCEQGKDASYQIWVNRTSPAPAEEYYLVGSKYNWATDASRLFESSGTSGEFVIKGVTFEENELIKVVKVVNNKFKAWYPANDYVISSEEAGIKDIYFRPEAYGPWGNGHIYLASPSTPTGVEEMSNESTIKAEKSFKDGKLFIRMGDKTFDLMGRQIK